MKEKTIFKKIIDGEIPATTIYEDSDFLAFLDISPVVFGHTLLIPKKEYVWIQEMPDDEIGALFIQAKKLIQAIKKGVACDYVQLSVVGKDVPHVHIHLIPRNLDDGLEGWAGQKYKEDEMDTYAQKIKSAL